MVNADKKESWPANIEKSVEQYNQWFLKFAPKAFKETYARTVEMVKQAIEASGDLSALTADVLRSHPRILQTLRMCCFPPLARDRVIGLAGVPDSLVDSMEKGKLPQPRTMRPEVLTDNLGKIVAVIKLTLDEELFPWIKQARAARDAERQRASSVVADRLCTSIANSIVRQAQEKRQIEEIRAYLTKKGYVQERPASLDVMTPGTFCFQFPVIVETTDKPVSIPIAALVQPLSAVPKALPLMIECKSAGDFANVNKRRKEEGQKGRQLRTHFGARLRYVLFLCGYFGEQYLQYEAEESFDWVWEHRIADFDKFGL